LVGREYPASQATNSPATTGLRTAPRSLCERQSSRPIWLTGGGLALAAGRAQDDPGDIIVTILIAIAGAIVGGLIASAPPTSATAMSFSTSVRG
jgi:hypothetical protein